MTLKLIFWYLVGITVVRATAILVYGCIDLQFKIYYHLIRSCNVTYNFILFLIIGPEWQINKDQTSKNRNKAKTKQHTNKTNKTLIPSSPNQHNSTMSFSTPNQYPTHHLLWIPAPTATLMHSISNHPASLYTQALHCDCWNLIFLTFFKLSSSSPLPVVILSIKPNLTCPPLV